MDFFAAFGEIKISDVQTELATTLATAAALMPKKLSAANKQKVTALKADLILWQGQMTARTISNTADQNFLSGMKAKVDAASTVLNGIRYGDSAGEDKGGGGGPPSKPSWFSKPGNIAILGVGALVLIGGLVYLTKGRGK